MQRPVSTAMGETLQLLIVSSFPCTFREIKRLPVLWEGWPRLTESLSSPNQTTTHSMGTCSPGKSQVCGQPRQTSTALWGLGVRGRGLCAGRGEKTRRTSSFHWKGFKDSLERERLLGLGDFIPFIYEKDKTETNPYNKKERRI